MKESPRVLRHTLQPDLRHWENVPASFLFTTASDVEDEACFTDLSEYDKILTNKIFDASREAGTNGPMNG